MFCRKKGTKKYRIRVKIHSFCHPQGRQVRRPYKMGVSLVLHLALPPAPFFLIFPEIFLMALEVTKKLWTVDEVLQMVDKGLLPHDNHLELIRGELIEMSPMGFKHGVAVGIIAKLLIKLCDEQHFVWLQSTFPLDNFSAPEPDIALLKWKGDVNSPQPPGPKDILLVVEVADSSLSYDRKIKAPLYAEFGIPEYWILDLQRQCVEQYQLPSEDGYRRKTIVHKDQMLPLPGLGVEISVGALFGISPQPPQ